ncbi:MAG: helix-turn-helix transcriptional regulator [Marinibacterium sp.]
MAHGTGLSEDLLASAIAAQGSDGFVTALARWLHAAIAYDNITILAYFPARPPSLLLAQALHESVHANFERVYLEGAYLLDPFYDLHISDAPPGMYRLSDIAPDQFHRNRYFHDYYSATTLVDELAFAACPISGTSVHICLGRDSSSNAKFSAREIAQARRISPVVLTLAHRHWADLDHPGARRGDDIPAQLIESLRKERSITLSPRQAEVALLVLRGNSSVSIGLKLGISPQTVKVFRKQLYKKCRISSQAELFNLMLPLLGK